MTDPQAPPQTPPDEQNEWSLPPSHGIPAGVDTEPEGSPNQPQVPGQPQNPDEASGIG